MMEDRGCGEAVKEVDVVVVSRWWWKKSEEERGKARRSQSG